MKLVLLGTGSLFEKLFTILPAAGIDIVAALDNNPQSGFALRCPVDNVWWLKEIDELDATAFDLCFMCDYLRLLPGAFVSKHKVLNSHGGLLPKYRGFHGNGWAFINGETAIGYTIHRVDATLDGGPIVHQQSFEIGEQTTFSEIKAAITADIEGNLARVLLDYHAGKLPERAQDHSQATFVARRRHRDCYIDWSRSSIDVERFIRAMAPPGAPGAFTVFRNQKLTILGAELFPIATYAALPGHVVYRIAKRGVLVKTGDGVLLVTEVEYAGEKLSALDLFATTGYRLGVDLIGDKLVELGIIDK